MEVSWVERCKGVSPARLREEPSSTPRSLCGSLLGFTVAPPPRSAWAGRFGGVAYGGPGPARGCRLCGAGATCARCWPGPGAPSSQLRPAGPRAVYVVRGIPPPKPAGCGAKWTGSGASRCGWALWTAWTPPPSSGAYMASAWAEGPGLPGSHRSNRDPHASACRVPSPEGARDRPRLPGSPALCWEASEMVGGNGDDPGLWDQQPEFLVHHPACDLHLGQVL